MQSRGKFDHLSLGQLPEEIPAGDLAVSSIGLTPFPDPAQTPGKMASSLRSLGFNQALNRCQIAIEEPAISNDQFHAPRLWGRKQTDASTKSNNF